MSVCLYICVYDNAFCSPCPGHGYWLLSRPVVPPPHSDHWKQKPLGESTLSIRHEKGAQYHSCISYNCTYLHTTYLLINDGVMIYKMKQRIRLGRRPYIKQHKKAPQLHKFLWFGQLNFNCIKAYKYIYIRPSRLTEPTVSFNLIFINSYVGRVTLSVASMAAPACRSRQTTSSAPDLAALISSVSSLYC